MIVSNSTTLIILLDQRRMDLLENLFKKVYLPVGVWEEVTGKGEVELPPFFEMCPVEPLEELKLLLERGEGEAITLAIKKGLPLIIDEKKGRRIARNYGVKIIGLVGILILNIERGFLGKEEGIEFLAKIRKEGFRVSDKLVKEFKNFVEGSGRDED